MPGHLFVVRGDLTRLACDAWLLPTSRALWIEKHWLQAAPEQIVRRGVSVSTERRHGEGTREVCILDGVIKTPDGWDSGTSRSFAFPEWSELKPGPVPWLTRMATDDGAPASDRADWFASGARQFVERAAMALRGERPAHGRARHLLALPLVGTGEGGGWEVAGEIVRELVRTLTEVVRTADVDVALVAHSDHQFAAVQQERRNLATAGAVEPWSALSSDLSTVGERLAGHARQGRLVLFLGAGVSVGAGLPTWGRLLDILADRAELDGDDKAALANLPPVDQARIVRDRLERAPDGSVKTGALADAICDQVRAERYSLAHGLLAGLPVKESVTTNYDTLFEAASEAANVKTAVLPYSTVEGADRWLLKMHGCIEHKEDIVLTREDFLRYSDNRGALAGIVQALLITRHMLFVGFSLTDDNFLRIADEVRKVVHKAGAGDQGGSRTPFGTALLLGHSHLLPRLWDGDIECVSMADTECQISTREAARLQEILLDYVLSAASTNVSHLLDERYDALLSDDERRLRDVLRQIESEAGEAVRSLPAWQPVAEMLNRLGG